MVLWKWFSYGVWLCLLLFTSFTNMHYWVHIWYQMRNCNIPLQPKGFVSAEVIQSTCSYYPIFLSPSTANNYNYCFQFYGNNTNSNSNQTVLDYLKSFSHISHIWRSQLNLFITLGSLTHCKRVISRYTSPLSLGVFIVAWAPLPWAHVATLACVVWPYMSPEKKICTT